MITPSISQSSLYCPSVTEVLPENIMYERFGPERSKGLHLSGIINDLWYVRIQNRDFKQDFSVTAAIIAAGFAWEELLEKAWAAYYENKVKLLHGIERPGELQYDGVWMTPDGYDKENKVLHEFKLTTKSAKKILTFEESFRNWVWQTAGYCLALSCTKVVFWTLFIGHTQLTIDMPWKPARVFKIEFEFTQEQLDGYWKVLSNHKNWMIENGIYKPA